MVSAATPVSFASTLGGGRGRRDREHRTAGRGERVDGGSQGGGLAGAGGADHHHERSVAGDGLGGGVLRPVQPAALEALPTRPGWDQRLAAHCGEAVLPLRG